MTTIELVEHCANIFLDIVLPAVVLWIAYLIRSWLPKEATTHQDVGQLVAGLKTLAAAAAADHAAATGPVPVTPAPAPQKK